MINTDYHCHVLPGIDDGAKDTEISGKMLAKMKEQGIENIILTPHFYPHREKSVDSFLKKREKAFSKISEKNFKFYLGAEVAIEREISENPDIKKLAIEGTNLILLEPPFDNVGRWVLDEIHNLVCDTGLRPIIAHIHRYSGIFSKDDFNALMNYDAVIQINVELLRIFGGKRFLNNLIKNDAEIVFGSDAHNLDDRKPDYSPLKKLKDDVLAQSDSVLQKYLR